MVKLVHILNIYGNMQVDLILAVIILKCNIGNIHFLTRDYGADILEQPHPVPGINLDSDGIELADMAPVDID